MGPWTFISLFFFFVFPLFFFFCTEISLVILKVIIYRLHTEIVGFRGYNLQTTHGTGLRTFKGLKERARERAGETLISQNCSTFNNVKT